MFDWFRRGFTDAVEERGVDPDVPRDAGDHRNYHQGYNAGQKKVEYDAEVPVEEVEETDG